MRVNVKKYNELLQCNDDYSVVLKKILYKYQGVSSLIIDFPTGIYHFYPDHAMSKELYVSNTVGSNLAYKEKKIGLLLEKMQNVTISGNNSLFIFHGKMTTWTFLDCKNVRIENLTIDYQVPTCVDIIVSPIDSYRLSVEIPLEYQYRIEGNKIYWISDYSPYTGEPYWQECNEMAYTQVFKKDSQISYRTNNLLFDNLIEIVEVDKNKLIFTYSDSVKNINGTTIYQMRQTLRDHPGALIMESKNIVLENLNINYLHGFGIVAQCSEDIEISNCVFQAPSYSQRKTASYADFLQISSCKGDISIHHNIFDNPHDDAINIHGTFLEVSEILSKNKIKVSFMHEETAGFPNFFIGDEICFIDKNTLVSKEDVFVIEDIEGPNGKESRGSEDCLRNIILTLDRDIPDYIRVNEFVVENKTLIPNVQIFNNEFVNIPTRGVLVTTSGKVDIYQNKFHKIEMPAIYISSDANNWYESGNIKNVNIVNNVFVEQNHLQDKTYSIIKVEPIIKIVKPMDYVHKTLNINHNLFYLKDGNVLNAKSVNEINLNDNTFYLTDYSSKKNKIEEMVKLYHCNMTEKNNYLE